MFQYIFYQYSEPKKTGSPTELGMQASTLFWLFGPTILCAGTGMSEPQGAYGQMIEAAMTDDSTFKCKQKIFFITPVYYTLQTGMNL